MGSRGMGLPGMSHGGRRGAGHGEKPKNKSTGQQIRDVWPELREMIRPRRNILIAGFCLMIVNRLSGLVLPISTKFLIDNVITPREAKWLTPIVLSILGATLIQGVTSFSLTQLLSKAGQSLIAELRRKVQW